MLSNLYKTLMFISSFLPLYIILIIKFYEFDISLSDNIKSHAWIFIIFSFLIVASVVIFLYFLFCEMNTEIDVGQVENMNSEILTYFITYIVPLITLEEHNLNFIIINIILFMVIGIFFVKSDQFYLNVLFTLFGFNLYIDNNKQIILSKKSADKINNRESVRVKLIGRNIYIINEK